MTEQPTAQITVRRITPAAHAAFLRDRPASSFLQNPQWPAVKIDWRGESVGLFAADELIGAALVLYRRLPVPALVPYLGRRCLAYMAEGPVVDFAAHPAQTVLPPLIRYLKTQGAFLVRMGLPGEVRRWEAATVRKALSAGEHSRLAELTAAEEDRQAATLHAQLQQLGWQPPQTEADFDAGQPQFTARIPLEPAQPEADPEEDLERRVEAALARMDSTSRRQTRKSTRSELSFSTAGAEQLDAWQALYEETAQRDDFLLRPKEYFQRMFAALDGQPDTECTLHLAHWNGTLLAAAIYIRQGKAAWYAYGASSSQERKRYAPRGLQLQQLRQALQAGCTWYDLGGISPSLDPEHPLAGLTRFKTTMGADAVETHGEWDLPLNRPLAAAFKAYMARRW